MSRLQSGNVIGGGFSVGNAQSILLEGPGLVGLGGIKVDLHARRHCIGQLLGNRRGVGSSTTPAGYSKRILKGCLIYVELGGRVPGGVVDGLNVCQGHAFQLRKKRGKGLGNTGLVGLN
jgi:hypothetical protein